MRLASDKSSLVVDCEGGGSNELLKFEKELYDEKETVEKVRVE